MNDDKVVCPVCGSTHIHAHARGFSWFWGFIGSGRVRITCLKCTHEFLPGGKPVPPVWPWVLGFIAVPLVFVAIVRVGDAVQAQRDASYAHADGSPVECGSCNGDPSVTGPMAPNDPLVGLGSMEIVVATNGKSDQQRRDEQLTRYNAFMAALYGPPANSEIGREEAKWLKSQSPSEIAELKKEYPEKDRYSACPNFPTPECGGEDANGGAPVVANGASQ
ncbi:hypothetical protein IST455A_00995 [Burkholderia multivorans]|uniref:hypothetical protein n=1 Tax=Burkholderia multivorans TaxID=87883 RepID=UPI00123C51C1|nr:hypothetical protein [Burkholderia multivorans]MBU9247679.1 hypothetical protein [Burkholderia multivorans]QET31702.1 hypothetical protein FOB31_18805 [Burkholderia multivorans]QET40878.1 hypothetical protein FOB30_25055 [Burkholderia multivorans]CAB5280172.1 hypothetical protein IST495A_03487 [Burkholderia multivorans]CAB5300563.1 hypothetical protein IST419_01122 [Burkholderia multivorans]